MDMCSWLHLNLQQNYKKIGSTHHAKQGNLVAEIEAIEDLEVSVLFFSFILFFSLIIHNCIFLPLLTTAKIDLGRDWRSRVVISRCSCKFEEYSLEGLPHF